MEISSDPDPGKMWMRSRCRLSVKNLFRLFSVKEISGKTPLCYCFNQNLRDSATNLLLRYTYFHSESSTRHIVPTYIILFVTGCFKMHFSYNTINPIYFCTKFHLGLIPVTVFYILFRFSKISFHGPKEYTNY